MTRYLHAVLVYCNDCLGLSFKSHLLSSMCHLMSSFTLSAIFATTQLGNAHAPSYGMHEIMHATRPVLLNKADPAGIAIVH